MKVIISPLLALAALSSITFAESKKADIVDTAVAAGSFKTLAAALKAADLVEALKGDGPFTVFAPTDEAFAKLPKGTVESLLKPENKSKLSDILTYHVVSGKVPARKALKLESATALNKKDIALEVRDGALYLNESKVVKTDIKCANGIIHVIDAVLLPPAGKKVSRTGTQGLMTVAIEKGVRLFNHGQHGACADLYEIAARASLQMKDTALDSHDRKVLEAALQASSHSRCDTTRAWTMRRALDRVMVSNR
ncbi:MAG: hypothetical protein CMP28_08185 [Roseibacillus sp.]|nr:hypothetical protein [Roseibacillus sp.]